MRFASLAIQLESTALARLEDAPAKAIRSFLAHTAKGNFACAQLESTEAHALENAFAQALNNGRG